jgi:hypothetical protein
MGGKGHWNIGQIERMTTKALLAIEKVAFLRPSSIPRR